MPIIKIFVIFAYSISIRYILMKNLLIVFTVLISILALGCNSYKYGASGESNASSSLTFGMVKSKIIKSQTTQAEIIQIFGSPNITTKNRSNNEVWSYNKMSVVSKGGETSFLSGSKGSYSSSTASFDLIISFDTNDIVVDYSVISVKY